jgi:benzodiazapine receptor
LLLYYRTRRIFNADRLNIKRRGHLKMKKLFKFAISIVICQAAGALGGIFTAPAIADWYQTLNKPSWTPAGSVIGAVWTILYLLMGISLYLAWVKDFEVKLPANGKTIKTWNPVSDRLLFGEWRRTNVILVFCAQLVLNIAWSFIFFKLELPGALWVAIVYAIVNFYRVTNRAGYLLIPYLLWVTFAGYLNFTIWQLN